MRINKTLSTGGVAVALAAIALTGCGTSSGGGSKTSAQPGQSGFVPPKMSAATKLGSPEGAVSVLAWPGYAEDGSTDPKVDWVHPFEKETGCKVTVKTFGTSDEALTLFKTGQYDVVSASGDASLRMIAAGLAQPVNLKLTKSYEQIQPFLKDRAWNTVNKVNYGMPHGWGANVLMYNTDKVKPAPTSWSVVFDEKSPYKGKITAYDSPIYIADAALYLMKHQPDLGIKNPYALDDKQLSAAVDLLKKQRGNVGEYWSDVVKEGQSFKSGNTVVGTTWQIGANLAKQSGAKVDSTLPSEGGTGWSDTWMVHAKTKHLTCSYKWMDYIASPKVNAQVAEYFGEAPANKESCQYTSDKNFCKEFHADDKAYADKIWYWTTPIKQCLDGRKAECTDYSTWTQKWTDIKG